MEILWTHEYLQQDYTYPLTRTIDLILSIWALFSLKYLIRLGKEILYYLQLQPLSEKKGIVI